MGGGIKRKPRKQTKEGGLDSIKRSDFNHEPEENPLATFYNMIQSEASRPDFDRDKFIRANNFSKEVIELIDGIININKDEQLSGMMSIGQAMSEGNLEEAKRLIDEAERRGYNHFTERYMILVYEGKFEEALELCSKNMASNPSRYVIECMADVLREMGRMQEQLDLFDQWDAQFHDDPKFLAARARALVAARQLDEAERATTRSLELDDDLPILQFITLGEIQLAHGNPEGALDLFNRTLDMDKNETDACIGKANALAAMGKYEQAILVCEQFLRRVPIRGQLKRTRDRIRAAAQV